MRLFSELLGVMFIVIGVLNITAGSVGLGIVIAIAGVLVTAAAVH